MSCARVSRGRALSPTSRSALELRLCEPVSNRRRTGLRCAETEIGKYRAETTAPKAYFPRYNSAKVQPETGRIHPKPRECGSVPETEPVTNRDWNGWLGRQDSNSRVQRRGPDHKGGRPCGTFFCKKDWTSAAHRASVSSSMPADWPHRDPPPLATPPQRGFGGDGT